ncbi:MAG: hypothetical protein LBF42_00195 [Puniceicoccales bacterium]|nr:hypothetical protein [Puniceicoccales bacterium]
MNIEVKNSAMSLKIYIFNEGKLDLWHRIFELALRNFCKFPNVLLRTKECKNIEKKLKSSSFYSSIANREL